MCFALNLVQCTKTKHGLTSSESSQIVLWREETARGKFRTLSQDLQKTSKKHHFCTPSSRQECLEPVKTNTFLNVCSFGYSSGVSYGLCTPLRSLCTPIPFALWLLRTPHGSVQEPLYTASIALQSHFRPLACDLPLPVCLHWLVMLCACCCPCL